MQLTKDLGAERIHFYKEQKILSDIAREARDHARGYSTLTEEALFEKVEGILVEKIKNGDQRAYFQLGLLFFEQGDFSKARIYFMRSKDFDFQSLYQLSVMMYDGIGGVQNTEEAVELMMKLSNSPSRHSKHLLSAVRYNIGRSYFQGYGVKRQSDSEAERWWLLAADDGNPLGSIKAQGTLGLFYSRSGGTVELNKAFFWHSEACGNGNLESQGALGVMYLYGVGVKADSDAAYICLRDASDRGNVYAMGNLISLFYQRKLYTKAADLASKVAVLNDIDLIARETDCLPGYISKGVSMACFFFARCLYRGLGVKQDPMRAKEFYSRSYRFDSDVCARLQNLTQHGVI
ncbi:LRP2-binding protein-like [Littorina saxatilis]|uniref:LRP2-binding protein n=1 Tax=Littorina saxatilis TaxID=31220 RepID=A0AAN9BPJ2_9CAEN